MKLCTQWTMWFTLIIIFTSCEKVRICDCDDPNRQFFSLIDAGTKKNLLHGSSKKFYKDSISVFSTEMKNGKNFRTDYIFEQITSDSTFGVYLNKQVVKRYFIAWNNTDLDTIEIKTNFKSGSCCGDIHLIDSLYFNKFPCINKGIWILEKK